MSYAHLHPSLDRDGVRREGARRRDLHAVRSERSPALPGPLGGGLVHRGEVPGLPRVAESRAVGPVRLYHVPQSAGLGASMIGVDVGGTFTDVVAVRDGRIITAKV